MNRPDVGINDHEKVMTMVRTPMPVRLVRIPADLYHQIAARAKQTGPQPGRERPMTPSELITYWLSGTLGQIEQNEAALRANRERQRSPYAVHDDQTRLTTQQLDRMMRQLGQDLTKSSQ